MQRKHLIESPCSNLLCLNWVEIHKENHPMIQHIQADIWWWISSESKVKRLMGYVASQRLNPPMVMGHCSPRFALVCRYPIWGQYTLPRAFVSWYWHCLFITGTKSPVATPHCWWQIYSVPYWWKSKTQRPCGYSRMSIRRSKPFDARGCKFQPRLAKVA